MSLLPTALVMFLAGAALPMQAAPDPLDEVLSACSAGAGDAVSDLVLHGWRDTTDSELAFAQDHEHLAKIARFLASIEGPDAAIEGLENVSPFIERLPSRRRLSEHPRIPSPNKSTALATGQIDEEHPSIVWIAQSRYDPFNARCTFWGYASSSSTRLQERLMEVSGPPARNDVTQPFPDPPTRTRQSIRATSVAAVLPAQDGRTFIRLSTFHTDVYQNLVGTPPPIEIILQTSRLPALDATRPD